MGQGRRSTLIRRWSFITAALTALSWTILLLVTGEVPTASSLRMMPEWIFALAYGLVFCQAYGFLVTVFFDYGFVVGLVVGLVFGMAYGLVFGMAYGLPHSLAFALTHGLVSGLVYVLSKVFTLSLWKGVGRWLTVT